MPEEEQEALFDEESSLVTTAMPGTTDTPGVVFPDGGDGSITESGRYLYFCSFPQGTTPEDVENATGPLESRHRHRISHRCYRRRRMASAPAPAMVR